MSRAYIIYGLLIILIGLIVIGQSINLGFSGDDWLTLYRFRINVGDWSPHKYNYLTYFLSPYGPQDTVLGLIQKTFGYKPYIFYSISLFLRTITALTTYWFVMKFTKNNLAGFLSGVFFMVSVVGLETTNWVFNMPSYISLTFFLLFVYNFFQSQFNNSYKNALLSIPMFYLTFIFAPIRMHGLPVITLLLDLFWILKSRNIASVKIALFHQISFITTLAFIKISGHSIGLSLIGGSLGDGINVMLSAINKFDFSFLLTPLIVVGRFFIPETVWPIIKSTFPEPTIISIVFYTNLLLLPLIVLNLQLAKNKLLQILFLSLCIIAISVISKSSYTTIIPDVFGAALMGGEFLTMGIFLIIRYFKESISTLLFFSFAWIFVSFFYPFILSPYTYFGTTHRYLVIPLLGFSIFWGLMFSLSQNKHLLLYCLGVYLLFFFVQVNSANLYLKPLLESRNSSLSAKIWNSLPIYSDMGHGSEPKVFYFEGDSNKIYQTITFGFPPHVAMQYNFNENQGNLPISVLSWEELVTTTTTGNNMSAYNYPQKPVSLDNIYVFSLVDDQLKDISVEKRKILQKLL